MITYGRPSRPQSKEILNEGNAPRNTFKNLKTLVKGRGQKHVARPGIPTPHRKLEGPIQPSNVRRAQKEGVPQASLGWVSVEGLMPLFPVPFV